MQLLYERLSGGEADDESLDLVYEQLSMAQPEGSAQLRPSKDERQYISDVLTGVEEYQSELDDSIEKHSTGAWALSRVPHVDLSILRLAAYELYHRADVPDNVAVSEAMEMAAEKATDEEIAELEEILAKELELARTDYEDFMDTDRAFHCALAHATHNLVMARLIPTLHASIYYDFVRGYYPQLRRAYNHNVNEYHVAIVRHLKLRDGRGANLAMRCHMLQGIHDLRSTIKE